MKPMTLAEVCSAVNGTLKGNAQPDQRILGVVIDNRKLEPDFLFVPIRGERFDGHDFIPSAYQAGALCCLSEKELDISQPYILVQDTQQAFQDLAAYYKSLFDIRTIGITGSAGKTTTKEMIADVLEQKYKVCKTQGNFNNQTGVPLTLFTLEEGDEVAVIEMGTNHFGEIRALSKIVRPDDCFLTNIGEAHIEHLGSREGILKAKCEMLEYMREDGRVFINGDDDQLIKVHGCGKEVVAFGFGEQNDICAVDVVENGLAGSKFKAVWKDGEAEMTVPLPGRVMVQNALAALVAGLAYQVPVEDIQEAVAYYVPVGNRMKIEQAGGVTIVNDVYNANPGSMKAAIDALCSLPGRKVCILGDMLELGGRAAKFHRETGAYAAERGVELVLGVGEWSQNTCSGAQAHGAQAQWFGTQDELIGRLPELIHSGDAVLVKASRGMELERTVDALTGRNS